MKKTEKSLRILGKYVKNYCNKSEIINPNNSKVISVFSSQNEEEVILKKK